MSDSAIAGWIGLVLLGTLFFVHPRRDSTHDTCADRILAPPRSLCTSHRGVIGVPWIANLTGAIFKDRPVCFARRDFDSGGREREGNIGVTMRGKSANPLRCNRRRRTRPRLHLNASPRGPSETLIAGHTFDCTGATRYANSPLFPDRVLKAWTGHYAAVELVYGVP